jgi:hypothetical protein
MKKLLESFKANLNEYFEQDVEKRKEELKKMLKVFADHIGAGDLEVTDSHTDIEKIIPQIRDHYNISDDTENEAIVSTYRAGDFDSYEPAWPGMWDPDGTAMDKTWNRQDDARKEKWDQLFSSGGGNSALRWREEDPPPLPGESEPEQPEDYFEQPPPLEESKAKIKKSQLVKVIAEEMSKMLKEDVEWIDRSEWKSNQPSGRDDVYEPSDLKYVRDALGPEYYVVDHEDMGEFRNFVQKKGAEGPNGEEVVVLLSTVSSPDAGRTNYFKTAHTDKYGKVAGMEGGLAQPKPAFGDDPEGLAAHWDSSDALKGL